MPTHTPQTAISLRFLTNNDWQLWRNLRLQALEEAPYAFSSRLVEWQGDGDTEARWRSRLSAAPINIVAELNGVPAGMVSGTGPSPEGTVELFSMWVAPFARGQGVGDALVSAVVNWAQEQRASKIVLAVFEDNAPAVALYRRHHFVQRGPFAQDRPKERRQHQMVRDL